MHEESKSTGISKVGIVGLGLIGGSLAKAVKHRTGVEKIVAVDPDVPSLEMATKEGVISDYSKDDLSILSGCDLVVLCAPVDAIKAMQKELSKLDIGLITDVGSVKTPVMDAITLPNFVGGHPMAGSERHGYACSSEALFENALYVICVPDSSEISAKKLEQFENLIRAIGAIPMRMTAKEHDARVAAVSHLPHIVASSLSLLLANLDDGAISHMAAGGFRDIPVLEKYIDLLSTWKDALSADDKAQLEKLFAQGGCYRDHLDTNLRGALEASSMLTVYVDDKPGELARITAILGKGNINIRNINIRNFRTYEGGQVSLLLGTAKEAVEAYALLKEAGYECD